MAFRTQYSYFEYQVIPSGLSNSPTDFQGYINEILAEKIDVIVIIYLNDNWIFTNKGDHVDIIWYILDQFQKHFLYANQKKCQFHQKEERFLGNMISQQGICIENKRSKTICDGTEPLSVQDSQVFFGFANFYRRFIYSFSCTGIPLTFMLKTMGSDFLTRLVTIGEGSTTQLVSIKDSNIIDGPYTKQGRDIERVDSNSNKADEFGVVDINSTKVSKLVKSQDLV